MKRFHAHIPRESFYILDALSILLGWWSVAVKLGKALVSLESTVDCTLSITTLSFSLSLFSLFHLSLFVFLLFSSVESIFERRESKREREREGQVRRICYGFRNGITGDVSRTNCTDSRSIDGIHS